MKATFEKEVREAAKTQGKGLWGMVCETKSHKMVAGGPTDHDLASRLFLFCTKVRNGEKPEDVVASVWKLS